MKRIAPLAVVVVLCACGSGTAAGSSPSPSLQTSPTATITATQPSAESPLPSASPDPLIHALRLLYRTYDGNNYGLAAGNADGTDVIGLSGPSFAHPDLIRFTESRNRRWAAWSDGGHLWFAASVRLAAAQTLTASSKPISVLAVSDDGDTVAYEVLTETGPEAFAGELYSVHVHDRSIKLLRNLTGPFITCLGSGAFDELAQRLIGIGCGAGQAAGLLLLNAVDGSVISEDDGFSAWPDQWAFSRDLRAVWLIVDGTTEADVVHYDTTTRARQVLYRSPVWKQSDGSAAPNLLGPVLLAPDESVVVFGRFTQDHSPEVNALPSGGGNAIIIFKDGDFGLESWSPDGGYVAVSVGSSTPSQRMRLINPRTKSASAVTTAGGYVAFLGWIAGSS